MPFNRKDNLIRSHLFTRSRNFSFPGDKRQFPRHNDITQVTLIAGSAWKKITVLAATLDISSHGLRIQTPIYLIAGDTIDVVFPGEPANRMSCRVAWTKPAGTLRPGEAGLTFLKPVQDILPGVEQRTMVEPPAMAA